MPVIDQLRGFRALEGFSLQQLAALAAEGEERDAAPGEILFREDEEASEMLFLLEGKLEVRSREKHIADVTPLSLVGELGVLANEPRSASIVAVAHSVLLALSSEDFRRLAASDPDLGMKFYRNLAGILAEQLKKNNLLVEFFQSIG